MWFSQEQPSSPRIRPPRTIPMFNQLKEFGAGSSFQIARKLPPRRPRCFNRHPATSLLPSRLRQLASPRSAHSYTKYQRSYLVSQPPSPKLYLDLFNSGKIRGPIFHFEPLQQSEACRFLQIVNRDGPAGLLSLETQQTGPLRIFRLSDNVAHAVDGFGFRGYAFDFPDGVVQLMARPPFAWRYDPTWQETSAHPYPRDRVAPRRRPLMPATNWELFFHVPS